MSQGTGHGFSKSVDAQDAGSGGQPGEGAPTGRLNGGADKRNGSNGSQGPHRVNQAQPAEESTARGPNSEQVRQRINSQMTSLRRHQNCQRQRLQHHQQKSLVPLRTSQSQVSMRSLPLPPGVGMPRADERRPISNDTYVYDDDDDGVMWNAAIPANPWSPQYSPAPMLVPSYNTIPVMPPTRNHSDVGKFYQAPSRPASSFAPTTGHLLNSQLAFSPSMCPDHCPSMTPKDTRATLPNRRSGLTEQPYSTTGNQSSSSGNIQGSSQQSSSSPGTPYPGPTPPKASWILRTIMGGMQGQTNFSQSFLPPPRGRRNSYHSKGAAAQNDLDFDANDGQQQYPREDDDEDMQDDDGLEALFDRHWRHTEDDNEAKLARQNANPGGKSYRH